MQKRSKRVTWAIWWCLEPSVQTALMQLQWDEYGYRLMIPPLPGDIHVDTEMESLEEIGRIITRRPRHYKGVK